MRSEQERRAEHERRVLVIDDDEDGAEGLADVLEVQGFSVAIAHDSKGAMEKMESFKPQVALVDLRLGRENGLDLIVEFKDTYPDVISVVITGNADRESAIGALRRGAYDYLTKPVNLEELFQALGRSFDLVRLVIDNKRMIRELEAAKDQAEKLALNDSLTGLANRYSFQTQLDLAINHAKRLGKLAAVLIIDLDGFKLVNDTHGHVIGDELLKGIARRLKETVRSTDTVARLGGDEFAVILANIDKAESASRPAELILRNLKQPIDIGGLALEVGACVGISMSPLDGEDHGELIRRADVALYAAKALGPGSLQYYDADLDRRARIQRELKQDLKRAFSKDEFVLFFQPQVAIDSNTVIGVEALLRWNHPHRGVLSPGHFIDAAESSGLIIELGRWVVRAACRQSQIWTQKGLQPLRMAVNISPRQLRDTKLFDTVDRAIADSGMDPDHLELELTENAVLADEEQASIVLHKLRALGLHLAIDDFGTGYSSLSRLKEYPVDRLKIDRTFIDNLTDDPGDQSICYAAVNLAASLGLGVIAEGVETKAQLEYLRGIKCDEGQGFFFAQPLPAAEFEAWLAQWNGEPTAAPADEEELVENAPLAAAS